MNTYIHVICVCRDEQTSMSETDVEEEVVKPAKACENCLMLAKTINTLESAMFKYRI